VHCRRNLVLSFLATFILSTLAFADKTEVIPEQNTGSNVLDRRLVALRDELPKSGSKAVEAFLRVRFESQVDRARRRTRIMTEAA
jgi:hypothetical protein